MHAVHAVTPVEEIEMQLLLDGMARHWGFDFRQWAVVPLRRRVDALVRQSGLGSISALLPHVLHDPAWRDRLLLALSLHDVPFFGDPGFWLAFRHKLVPVLRTYPQLRFWVPGCSGGADVWSLAVLLAEEGLYARSRIHATDMNEAVVRLAERGILPVTSRSDPAASLRASGGGALSSHVSHEGDALLVAPTLRRNVLFAQHNLGTDASPNAFHVILFRDGMLSFDHHLQDHVHRLLARSLVPFGMLALGRGESLRGTLVEDRYETVSADERIYRRVR
jgi:chemotaxis protein methyltransferase CheR